MIQQTIHFIKIKVYYDKARSLFELEKYKYSKRMLKKVLELNPEMESYVKKWIGMFTNIFRNLR